MSHSIQAIRAALSDGLLSFPVTDMDPEGAVVPEQYGRRIEWMMQYDLSAVFVAGGTGEFFSLSGEEYRQVIETAVRSVWGRVPVISSVGRSMPEAIRFAAMAEQAGIDALLLMPPYLTACPEQGLFEYAKAIMNHTALPVIYYNRSNGILSAPYLEKLAATCPNLIGIKDGTGDMQALNDLIKTVGDRLVYIGGFPTAEIIAEAYLSIGVHTYSSAVFNFVPELAVHFYRCLRKGEQEKVQEIIRTFYIPLIRLRTRQKGYAVSLIKAGARLIGKDAGSVRAPLVMPTPEEEAQLQALIQTAAELIP